MRILLMEDEEDLGIAIKRSLLGQNYVVDWVTSGQEGLYLLENPNITYNIGIFDWLLPELSGIELLKIIRQQKNSLPVLMLTAKDTMMDKIMGLDAGADDYLIKPFEMLELFARIRALLRRNQEIKPQQLKVKNLILDYQTNTIQVELKIGKKEIIPLTNKEFHLLEFFMRHPQQILTKDQLLDQLWEIGSDTISNVVAAQIRLLRKKLNQYGYGDLIETVYGLGYRLKLDN
ncbi:MAG: response regulator transcription factor [Cyanobacteria bacterium]|nr:response regulator transcription factor [Cyanobacteria bacterium CG_2015-16_32_12]NCO79169.1 response regulator transcription factor [Cyanobacteria bacterium CG_2015-22_32_23]NCQ04886.1 response regulator transcription factor [Cyanobacteria bacterium CG_2015-09_32_10]NCQ41249.1 response regulator transcription factor [Cyanobacteria bacterium CG_2015-04_32_10]NCS84998.1 response regulator transcription factor [Cyanobacteria bacterium CG_2015-02_32_10]